MDFDVQWLLLGLPIAFAFGWLASRFDVRQWRREQRDSPRAYFKGLNLLLNEQTDKAIDAFIEAVQQDPDTSDLHFALGNLFRRRGEYERAVRVHQHLLARADLSGDERDRARHAMAQDYLKAGLIDRAEAAFRDLEGTAYDTEARLALLALAERSRDWHGAIELAQRLEKSGTGSYATRIAHYWCELALEAEARGRDDEADSALQRAREAAPHAARPIVLVGQRLARQGRHRELVELWGEALAPHPALFNVVAGEFATSAVAAGAQPAALQRLLVLYRRAPTASLLGAINRLDPDPAARRERLLSHLAAQPTLSAALALLEQQAASGAPVGNADAQLLGEAVARAARPLQRYRCAACGFEAQQYFWQCPGCLGWDTFPPQRLEDL
ncbi:MAG TPA: lipopolysaccharide assembly protein LapB [Ideonella sp.]|nr:lipopolysaccharide assembly protein LapB [Ideonella sp.]